MSIRDGCKRNATTKLSKTANIVRAPTLTHVAANRIQRLRPGIYEIATKQSKVKANNFRLLILIMTINMIVKQQVIAASMNMSKVETVFLNEICSMDVKWKNACRGQWEKDGNTSKTITRHVPRDQVISQYNTFKKAISTTYNELKSSTSDIDISDMNTTWQTYKDVYRFLPRLRRNSLLKLRSWHRKAQIYTGSLNYLLRAQLYFDLKHTGMESNLSKTLKTFEQAALKILCEIETTINATSPSNRSLHRITPEKMNNIIKFHTEMKQFYSNTCKEDVMDSKMEPPLVNSIDLRYVKKQFLGFLRAMRKIVKWKIAILQKRNSRSSMSRSSNSMSSSRYNSNKSYSSIGDFTSESNLSLSESSRTIQSFEIGKHGLRRHGKNKRHHRTSI